MLFMQNRNVKLLAGHGRADIILKFDQQMLKVIFE